MNLRKLELEDQPWFPGVIKECMTDYLRFVFHFFNLYQPVVPLLKRAFGSYPVHIVLDLCSGSGGAVSKIREDYKDAYSCEVRFLLSDLYPRVKAWEYLASRTLGNISFVPWRVDAINVPPGLKGFRTMFSGIHHFRPEEVKAILKNAVAVEEGIAIFDGGDKNLLMILLILIFHPLALFFLTPFIRPFRFSRLFFTYLIPIIPVGVIWDGLVSVASLYKPGELLRLVPGSAGVRYKWEAGKLKNRFGLSISFLIGTPMK